MKIPRSLLRVRLHFSCQGKSINPSLQVRNIPTKAESLVLIMEDPDAPKRTFVHWVVYNIPLLDEIREDSIPGMEGVNSSGEMGYFPPCPPAGSHRYFFTLYALDKELDLDEGANKETVQKAMEGHILESAELIGVFEKD